MRALGTEAIASSLSYPGSIVIILFIYLLTLFIVRYNAPDNCTTSELGSGGAPAADLICPSAQPEPLVAWFQQNYATVSNPPPTPIDRPVAETRLLDALPIITEQLK